MEAAAVACEEDLALRLGGAAHGVGAPDGLAVAVIQQAGELGVAGEFFEDRVGQTLAFGRIGHELAGGVVEVRDL